MKIQLEAGKEYRTVNGHLVRIYSTDNGGGVYPVHGAHREENSDIWRVAVWTQDGKYFSDETKSSFDIVPPTTTVYVNVYFSDESNELTELGAVHTSKEEADNEARGKVRIGCVTVEWQPPAFGEHPIGIKTWKSLVTLGNYK
jgi:hypothetical protein